jgi:hypothetical protein
VATPEERPLALAVARGLVEPEEVRGVGLDDLMSSGRLAEADRALLAEDLETFSDSHWSVDMTGPARQAIGGSEAPTYRGLPEASAGTRRPPRSMNPWAISGASGPSTNAPTAWIPASPWTSLSGSSARP